LAVELFLSVGFHGKIQFKTKTEAFEFKHSSIASANNSQNVNKRDQPKILENENEIGNGATSNKVANSVDKPLKTVDKKKPKLSTTMPTDNRLSSVDGDNSQTSMPSQNFTPSPPVPKSQRNAPKLRAKKK
jgi:hypothetical protein